MHGYIYSTRKGLRIFAPYGEDYYDIPRDGRNPLFIRLRKAVHEMLESEAEQRRRKGESVWWTRYPYGISVREDYNNRGTYVYSVEKVW